MRTLSVTLGAVLLSGRLAAQGNPAQPANPLDDPRVVREALTAINADWSRIRLGYDSAGAEALLAPDFYVAMTNRRLTRDEFIRSVATRGPASLTRFANPILTIAREAGKDEWTAIVMEKMEMQRPAPDGSRATGYMLWVTRDRYRRLSPTKWVIVSSEEVMHENWLDGRRPPIPDWDRP